MNFPMLLSQKYTLCRLFKHLNSEILRGPIKSPQRASEPQFSIDAPKDWKSNSKPITEHKQRITPLSLCQKIFENLSGLNKVSEVQNA